MQHSETQTMEQIQDATQWNTMKQKQCNIVKHGQWNKDAMQHSETQKLDKDTM